MPESLNILQKQKHQLFVSYLVKAEVSRYLRSEWQLNSESISEIWDEFIKEMKTEFIELEKFQVDLREMDIICSAVPLKKYGTIADLIHLKISKEFGLKFLTNEKKLKTRLLKFYDNIVHINEIFPNPF